jgi:hypothetical protein
MTTTIKHRASAGESRVSPLPARTPTPASSDDDRPVRVSPDTQAVPLQRNRTTAPVAKYPPGYFFG